MVFNETTLLKFDNLERCVLCKSTAAVEIDSDEVNGDYIIHVFLLISAGFVPLSKIQVRIAYQIETNVQMFIK